ncbi:hypothetical protein CHK_1758 [Christensenella hongkongensis]|uniref:Uncharacterized protein n=1 Tax=Christensenella hongkongensis TaxID=270498 RepID=A0A0M2NK56_9FIRM|nr:hypothetical protein CHK_1758 [Christensenella hongkongensis]
MMDRFLLYHIQKQKTRLARFLFAYSLAAFFAICGLRLLP